MFSELKDKVDGAMALFLADIDRDLGLSSSSSVLFSSLDGFVRREGKRIRPILLYLSYKGYTEKKQVKEDLLLRCCISLELLHDFLLIHDDVIDNSDLRRGLPTLHRVLNADLGLPLSDRTGQSLSIVAGDILFSESINCLLDIDEPPSRSKEALRIFTRAASSTGIGEFLDVTNNINDIDLMSEDHITLTNILKTSRYSFEAPLVMGAVLSGRKADERKKLSRLGIALGLAFQIHDDLLDVFSSSKKTGKPMLSDLNESKKTLLLLKTYEGSDQSGRKKLRGMLLRDDNGKAELKMFRELSRKAGSDIWCMKKASSLFDESMDICSSLTMRPEYRKSLEGFIKDLSLKASFLYSSKKRKTFGAPSNPPEKD